MKKTILSAICLVVFFSLALAILHPVPVHAATSLQPSAGQYREDFNGDGSVSIADVIRLIRMSWEKPTVPGCDYNGDGKFSAVDAVLLVRNILSGNLSPVETGPTAVEVPDSPVLAGPLAVSDCWPECTDLAGWARDVFRLDSVDQASETRKGISFYTWLRLFSRDCSGGMRQAYEGLPYDEQYVTDAHKNLFIYGWGYCDTHSRVAEAAWRELTGDPTSAYRVCVRNPSGGYHTMFRLRLDGNYGAFDALYGYYFIDHDSPDARILDWSEVGGDSNLYQNQGFENRCRPFFELLDYKASAKRYEAVYWDKETDWVVAGSLKNQVFASPMHQIGTRYHDMNWRMPRGTTITRYWRSKKGKWYIPQNRYSDFLPSGRFYHLSDISFVGSWVKDDPNFKRAEPYITTVPADENYTDWISGGKTIGQAWGRFSFRPELADKSCLDAVVSASNMAHQNTVPYLMPQAAGEEAEVVFQFYCPYIFVDGIFSGELVAGQNDSVSLQLRTLAPKTRNADQFDSWSKWIEIASGGGPFVKELGRADYGPGKVSVHGKYCFELRLAARASERPETTGLKSLEFACDFENGIMTIPQIFSGTNTINFKVSDIRALCAPFTITYNYETAADSASHIQTLQPGDFHQSGSCFQASYQLEAPHLVRCKSLEIRY